MSTESNPYIPFTQVKSSKKALLYLRESLKKNHLQGDGPFTKKCHKFLEEYTQAPKVLLNHSGTAALEMAALLIDLKHGDEVIMPSYTFSSTANAVVLRGATPVFIDIRKDTLNIDEDLIEPAITPQTKAILVVHYAGVSANMEKINFIAQKYNLFVIEDAAQGVGAFYKNKPLGTLSHLGAYSFHATKNIISGEGGALIINDKVFSTPAEIIREKGTNRSQFIRGEVDKYTWYEKGSSFLPSDLTAALLLSQLESLEGLTKSRLTTWNLYHHYLENIEKEQLLRRPFIPNDCQHNAHIYYLVLNAPHLRGECIKFMASHGIQCTSHYVPLHSSPAGIKYGRAHGEFSITNEVADQIIRLPLWAGMKRKDVLRVVEVFSSFFKDN